MHLHVLRQGQKLARWHNASSRAWNTLPVSWCSVYGRKCVPLFASAESALIWLKLWLIVTSSFLDAV